MLELLRNDRISEAYEYQDINVEEEKRRLDKLMIEGEPEKEKEKEEYKAKLNKCKSRIEFAEKMKQQFRKNKVGIPSTTSIQLFSEFVKFLNSCTQNKCPYLNCKRESKKVKKEGASKIFLIDREADDE